MCLAANLGVWLLRWYLERTPDVGAGAGMGCRCMSSRNVDACLQPELVVLNASNRSAVCLFLTFGVLLFSTHRRRGSSSITRL